MAILVHQSVGASFLDCDWVGIEPYIEDTFASLARERERVEGRGPQELRDQEGWRERKMQFVKAIPI